MLCKKTQVKDETVCWLATCYSNRIALGDLPWAESQPLYYEAFFAIKMGRQEMMLCSQGVLR